MQKEDSWKDTEKTIWTELLDIPNGYINISQMKIQYHECALHDEGKWWMILLFVLGYRSRGSLKKKIARTNSGKKISDV